MILYILSRFFKILILWEIIITSSPVKIKREGSLIGSTTGGLIGGLLATQVYGKELIAETKCEEMQ